MSTLNLFLLSTYKNSRLISELEETTRRNQKEVSWFEPRIEQMEQIIRVTAAAFSDFALDVELLSGVHKEHENQVKHLEAKNEDIVNVSE
mgnify:CR=1 FL=1